LKSDLFAKIFGSVYSPSTYSSKDYLPADPFCSIFNLSFYSGYLTNIWKQSDVVPLHKSGVKNLVSNYCCISKLCAIPKLLNAIIAKHMSFDLENIISPFQHGLLTGRVVLHQKTCLNFLLIVSVVSL